MEKGLEMRREEARSTEIKTVSDGDWQSKGKTAKQRQLAVMLFVFLFFSWLSSFLSSQLSLQTALCPWELDLLGMLIHLWCRLSFTFWVSTRKQLGNKLCKVFLIESLSYKKNHVLNQISALNVNTTWFWWQWHFFQIFELIVKFFWKK